jgi:hypothetical protein
LITAPRIAPQCARTKTCHDVGRSGPRRNPPRFQNPSDRGSPDTMDDVLQRAGDPVVAPHVGFSSAMRTTKRRISASTSRRLDARFAYVHFRAMSSVPAQEA